MRTVHLSRCGLIVMLFLAIWNVGQAQDSLGMSRVSTLDYWGYVNGIQMVGDLAYVVSGNILHIMNLADPTHPVEIGQGSWWYSASGSSVCVTGNLAYVAAGYGVVVFDVSDPAHPVTLVEWVPWAGCEIYGLFVHEDIAIVRINGHLYIVDISDLENIHIVGDDLPSSNWAYGMVGEYLCMGGSGLSMWDISDPTLPVKVAEVDTQFFIGPTAISGNYAYASTYTDGLRIIDVSNPLQPFEVGACDSSACEEVTVTGNYAIVSKGHGLNIWNVADPTQPVFQSSFGPQIWFSPSLGSSGSLVCVGDIDAHSPPLIVVDITEPHAPTQISTFGTQGFLRRMAVSGTIGYLAGSGAVLHTVDLSDPRQVVELGISNEEWPGSSLDIAIRGNYAYMACGTQGLWVFDIINPAQPDYVTSIDLDTDDIQRIVVVDDYAYVIDSYGNALRIFSLENPADPVCVNSISWHVSSYCGFEAENGYLYYGCLSGFYVYSLADPASPELVASCNLAPGLYSDVRDITLLDDYAYIAYRYGGIRIIHIINFAYPTEVGVIEEPTWAVAASGNTLMTFGLDGITARDVTDPLNPVTVGYYYYNTTNEWVRDMDILGSYLLTVAGAKFRVYQCDALSGIQAHPNVVPHEFALHPCYPNPFNASTVINYSLPLAGQIRLTIHNVLGQRVVTLYDGMQHAGTYSAIWDASQVGSGIYFARLQSGNLNKTIKMVLMK